MSCVIHRMLKCFPNLVLMVCLSSSMYLNAANVLYPLPTEKQSAQFKHLLSELRCLVCQNQDLADSNAGLANDLRMEVYHRVQLGQSDHEIIAYLTERYGDFILFNPPLKGVTFMLWSAPLMFVCVGLFLFFRKFPFSERRR